MPTSWAPLCQPLLALLIFLIRAHKLPEEARGGPPARSDTPLPPTAGGAANRAGGAAQPGRVARLHARIGATIAFIQVLVLLFKTDTDLVKRQEAAQAPAGVTSTSSAAGSLAVILVPLVLLPALAPAFFERHIYTVRLAARMVWFSQPYMRQPQGIPHVLQNQPSLKAYGLVKDVFAITLGSRTLGMLLAGTMLPVPLLPGLAAQIYAVLRCRDPASMCAMNLLASPAWARRAGYVHQALNALLLSWGYGRDAASDCRMALVFYHLLLGLVVPMLFVARFQAAAAGPAAVAEGDSRHMRRHRRRLQAQRTSRSSSPHKLAACASSCKTWLCRAATQAEASLQHLCTMLCGQAGSGFDAVALTMAAWLLLLSLLWSAALVLEAPVPLMGPAGN